jgi:bacterioferritin-associated ferredoxin
MIIARVTQYLKLNGRAALHDMATVLRIEPQALRAILHQLENSGRVKQLAAGTPCKGGCSKCSPQAVELFEWQRQTPPETPTPHHDATNG